MKEEVVKELRRRADLLIEHALPGRIIFGMSGSRIKFNMGLNLLGGPAPTGSGTDSKGVDYSHSPSDFPWWDKQYEEPIMTKDEFYSEVYDKYIGELHDEVLYKVKNRTK